MKNQTELNNQHLGYIEEHSKCTRPCAMIMTMTDILQIIRTFFVSFFLNMQNLNAIIDLEWIYCKTFAEANKQKRLNFSLQKVEKAATVGISYS